MMQALASETNTVNYAQLENHPNWGPFFSRCRNEISETITSMLNSAAAPDTSKSIEFSNLELTIGQLRFEFYLHTTLSDFQLANRLKDVDEFAASQQELITPGNMILDLMQSLILKDIMTQNVGNDFSTEDKTIFFKLRGVFTRSQAEARSQPSTNVPRLS